MKRLSVSILALASMLALSTSVSAATIVTITHDYGTGAGETSAPSLGAGSCDTLNANSITVRDSSGCQRFYDLFDFSGASYASISGFELQLTFALTSDIFVPFPDTLPGIFFLERWHVRPASSSTNAVTDDAEMPAMERRLLPFTQTFTFDNTLSIFDAIVAERTFGLWFSDTAIGANDFNLRTAVLTVQGERSAPEPATLALFGFALLAGRARLRRRFDTTV